MRGLHNARLPGQVLTALEDPARVDGVTTVSRLVGNVIKPLRNYTNEHLNREVRWDLHKDVPSGWAREKAEPGLVADVGHRFYDRLRRSDDGSRNGHQPRGRRPEWTQRPDPVTERTLPGGEES